MKKLLLLFSIFLVNAFAVFSQSQRQLPVMDSYIIPENNPGAIVGRIIVPDNIDVILSKDTSELFWLDEYSYVRLRSDVELVVCSPERYEIEIEYGDQTKSFELVKDNFINNKVVAHRGAWKNTDVSQNSLSSLLKAIELGCESSEFDVWLSADNRVILSHDPTIGGKTVEETNAQELFNIPLKNGDYVPSLEDYLEYIKQQNKTKLVLEVKASQKGKERSEAVADSCVQIVHRMNAQAWVSYITFDYNAALRIRALDPTAHILYLESDKSLKQLVSDDISGIDYHYSNFFNDEQLIDKAREIGLLTNAWTVNKKEDMETLLKRGIDYITTDEPELLLKIIEQK